MEINKFEIKPSTIPNSGQGLFAKVDIPRKTLLGEYKGIIKPDYYSCHEPDYAWIFESDIEKGKIIYLDAYPLDAETNPMIKVNAWADEIQRKKENVRWFIKNNKVYYETKKLVKAGEEFIVDYGHYHSIKHQQNEKLMDFNKAELDFSDGLNTSEKYIASGRIVGSKLGEHNMNDNILHVHIPKCAGSMLKRVIYDNERGVHIFNYVHAPAYQMKKDLGENWDKFKKFTVVRNPWDKLWSGYKYTKWGRLEESIKPYISYKTGIFTQNDEVLYEQWKKSGLAVISGFESNNKLGKTFKEYVNTLYKTYSKKGFMEPAGRNLYVMRQKKYIVEPRTNKLLVDFIGKYEDLDAVINWVASVNNDKNLPLRYRMQSKTKSNISLNSVNYRNVYDDDMINMVGEMYREDVDYFKYDFE